MTETFYVNATEKRDTKLHTFAQDIDVFVLSIRWYPELSDDSEFVLTIDQDKCTIHLWDIYLLLGPQRIAALAGFHALSGYDTTGALAGETKQSWKAFKTVECLFAFQLLGTSDAITHSVLELIICHVYDIKTSFMILDDMCWWKCSNKQCAAEKLPPTRDTFVFCS